jgi:hypothetical protein
MRDWLPATEQRVILSVGSGLPAHDCGGVKPEAL